MTTPMNEIDMTKMIAELRRDEDERLRLYSDTEGFWTIGIGRNLSSNGISRDECDLMLKNDVIRALANLDRYAPWWVRLDGVRKRVLLNLTFNMGWGSGKTGLSSFTKMLLAMKEGRYEDAATELLNSKYATQVGDRAKRLAELLRKGA